MEIRLRSTGEVLLESEFRVRFAQNLPNTPLTQEWLDSYTTDPAGDIVLEGPQASGGTVYQYSQRHGVEQIDGKWYTKYVLGPIFTDTPAAEGQPAKTASENEAEYKAYKDAEQAKAVRQQRDTLLKETDWRYRRDLTTTPEWDAYCQSLRDVPSQAGFPWVIDWPVQPE